jgi:hypothetical protein
VLNLAFDSKTKTLAIQLINGEIHEYKNDKLSNWLFDNQLSIARFPQPCAYFSICSTPDKELCVGLTDFYRLYINNKEIANNCTSFYIHDKYILYTTHDNNLKFIDFNKTGISLLNLIINSKFNIFKMAWLLKNYFVVLKEAQSWSFAYTMIQHVFYKCQEVTWKLYIREH